MALYHVLSAVKIFQVLFIICLSCFLGFYLSYCTSKKTKNVTILGFEYWAENNQTISKAVAMALLIIALAMAIVYLGWGAGMLLFFICIMTIGSLVILLTPLQLINRPSIAIFSIGFILAEILFF